MKVHSNYGKSPQFNVQHTHRFPIGSIDVRLDVSRGVISHCKIYGDFFGVGDVSDVEKSLTDIHYSHADIVQALLDIDVSHYFGNITQGEFIDLVY